MGGGLRSNPAVQAHHARDPYIPSQDILQGIEQPAVSTICRLPRHVLTVIQTREELRARAAELNK